MRKAPCEAGLARCAGAGCGFVHGFGDESTPDSQSGISRSRTALTPPPALRPALPLPVYMYHTSTECTRSRAGRTGPQTRVYSICQLSQVRGHSLPACRVVPVAFCPVLLGRDCVRQSGGVVGATHPFGIRAPRNGGDSAMPLGGGPPPPQRPCQRLAHTPEPRPVEADVVCGAV